MYLQISNAPYPHVRTRKGEPLFVTPTSFPGSLFFPPYEVAVTQAKLPEIGNILE